MADRFTGVDVALATCSLTSLVTREVGPTSVVRSGMVTEIPESSDAWKLTVTWAVAVSGFWRVRNSWKPGRTVPSAK